MLLSVLWGRCWIMMHRHFSDLLIWNVTFLCFIPKHFCHVCLLSLSRQCLFHVTYEPCLIVRHRKYIIVVPVLDKCRSLTFLCFYWLYKMRSLKPYTLAVLRPHQTAYITFAFCALLIKLLHLHHFIALAFSTKYLCTIGYNLLLLSAVCVCTKISTQ